MNIQPCVTRYDDIIYENHNPDFKIDDLENYDQYKSTCIKSRYELRINGFHKIMTDIYGYHLYINDTAKYKSLPFHKLFSRNIIIVITVNNINCVVIQHKLKFWCTNPETQLKHDKNILESVKHEIHNLLGITISDVKSFKIIGDLVARDIYFETSYVVFSDICKININMCDEEMERLKQRSTNEISQIQIVHYAGLYNPELNMNTYHRFISDCVISKNMGINKNWKLNVPEYLIDFNFFYQKKK